MLSICLIKTHFHNDEAGDGESKAEVVKEIKNDMSPEEVNTILSEMDNQNLPDEVVPDVNFEDVEMETEESGTQHEDMPEQIADPIYGAEGWSDFVMSHFADNEIFDGNPNVIGLRRVAGLLLGPIIVSRPVGGTSTPGQGPNDPGRATCVYEIKFRWQREDIDTGNIAFVNPETFEFGYRTFGATSGAYPGNLPDGDFQKHPEAMSETRAESRTLRKALMINIVSAEEMNVGESEVSFFKEDDDTQMSSLQKGFLETKTIQQNIDLDKLIVSNGYTSKEALTKDEAKILIAIVGNYQNGTNEVPENVKLEQGVV